jgi:2-octaprenyl-6-methoxyphenol hydroxylase
MAPLASAEVVVIGAGPVGLAAAVALAASGVEVALAAPPFEPARTTADRRTSALLPGSVQLLTNLGAWSDCAAHAADLEGVRIVDDRGALLRAPEVLFRARELGLRSLGVNIANAVLIRALHAAAMRVPRLRWLETAAVVRVEPRPGNVGLELAEGGAVSAALVVAADGRKSIGRAAAGISARDWSYGQTAIATSFTHTRPHGGITTELHRRAGPLTTVPLPGLASSLVWVETPAQARRLMQLDEAAFRAELTSRLQGLLGALGEIGPRALYPLAGLSAGRMAQNRIALVGEAAHVLPPIGAQGLNLGLRDAAALADCVAGARARGEDIGAAPVLDAYHAARAADVLTRTASVDLLNRSLLLDMLPAQSLRGLGLHLLANVGPLRRGLMRRGLEPVGRVPRLMRRAAQP